MPMLAHLSTNAFKALALGVPPCPHAYGALFDGGATCTSRPLDTHIARGSCRARWLGSLHLPRELDRHYIPTTTRGVTTTVSSLALPSTEGPEFGPMHSDVIMFCAENPDFTATHMRTSGAQLSAATPALALPVLTPIIVDLLSRTSSTRGVALKDAAREAFLLFPTLVLGPQRTCASSSNVRSKVDDRLDL
jgi:hypothetical protein